MSSISFLLSLTAASIHGATTTNYSFGLADMRRHLPYVLEMQPAETVTVTEDGSCLFIYTDRRIRVRLNDSTDDIFVDRCLLLVGTITKVFVANDVTGTKLATVNLVVAQGDDLT